MSTKEKHNKEKYETSTKKYQVETGQVNTTMVCFTDIEEPKEVSVTEWINGEGVDVGIDSKISFSLSLEEALALKFALSQIDL